MLLLLAGLVVGLLSGLLVGGRLDNLLSVRLRWVALIIGAVVLRVITEEGLRQGITLVDQLRVPLLASAYYLLAVGLWANRARPGFALAMIGILSNATVIVINRGFMPVWEPSLTAAGFTTADVVSPLHVIVAPTLDLSFLLRAGPLGDVLPIPIRAFQNVVSVGDVLLGFGLAFFLFASLVRDPADDLAGRASALALPGAAPRVGDRRRANLGLPARGRWGFSRAAFAYPPSVPAIGVPLLERVRRHAYVKLALNAPFSALWTGQLLSLFGDRIHQIALVFLVEQATHSAFAVGLVMLAATIPNLFFGPLAGVFVDRWNQKRVMWVSDLLRAAIVILIPLTITTNLVLSYVLVFLLTTVSIFFRPARTAVVPRLVAEDELMTANSATWLAETLADVVGYPLASVFANLLGSALALAFWVDAATYVVSAALILVTAIPPIVRRSEDAGNGETVRPSFWGDLVAGFRFLRDEAALRASTIQAVIGQFAIGTTIALGPLYAVRVIAPGQASALTAYGLMETAIGVGSMVGTLAIGAVAGRVRRGPLIAIGYVAWGASVAFLGLTDSLSVAVALALLMGIGNMVFVVPTQTMFMERTPADLIGRVISFRFSAVFGSMSLAMAVSGALGDVIGVAQVYLIFGMVTAIAGAGGFASRALRSA